MQHAAPFRRGLCLLGLFVTLWGCASGVERVASQKRATPTAPAPTPASTAEPAPQTQPEIPEASVKPGVNDTYLDPALDVEHWKKRFETDGRDIFDKRNDILKLSGVMPGMAVGDIGAGTGLFSLLFADAVGPQGKVYAVDIAKPFIELIGKRAKERRAAHLVPVLGNERDIGLAPESIDLAFLCDVYHHFEYPKSMLASIHRALRPGGKLMLIDMRREPGVSSAWTLEHVRAGEADFTRELVAAGFVRISRHDILKDNYVLLFEKR